MNIIKDFILSKKLDNSHRKEIKEKYDNIIEKCPGDSFNEKLYNFCYQPIKIYKNKKLKFISFQKGYDFDIESINNENDALLFFQYKIENNLTKGLHNYIKKNNYLELFWNKIPGETVEKIYRIKNNILFDKIICPICKIKEAKFQRYKGFTYCSHRCAQLDEKTREKAKQSNLKKLGVKFPAQSKKVKDKYKETCLERYGVENVFKSEKFKNKIKETNKEKYGAEHPVQSEKIKNKIKETIKKKYNCVWNSQINQKNRNNLNKEYIEKNFIKNKFLQFNDILEYFNISSSFLYKLLKEWDIKYDISSLEYELNKKYFNNIFKVKDRKFISPYEVDLINYEKKFGIEYDGVLWHSFGEYPSFLDNFDEISSKKYHLLEKTKKIEEKGFQLFHIFDTEWNNLSKRDIWISMINNKLGLNKKIYARKCAIKEISSQEAFDFFEINHLQGGIYAKYNLGLYFENELVACMNFSKPRYNKNIEWELIRFANKKGLSVIGGASKLLKYFEKNKKPKSLLSYANRRWSKGDLYQKLGFKFIEDTKPNYHYYKNGILYSRHKFQKHKLKKLFKNNELEYFIESESERINLIKNNFRIIYDCGNKKFIKNY